MSDIANWLDSIGLRKYANVFDANEIDLDAAWHLTEQDLVEIGLPLGPRRKVLAAILSHKPSMDEPSVGPGTGEAGERRHITVIFADIVGSTELSERLDPKILSELLRIYQNVVSQQLRDFGGHLAKFMGDGVMAYFGWPQASEDAVERALRASLEIITAVTKIRTPDGAPLQLRIGIASGLVVVGGLIGSGAAQEEAIAGDTPNLAARLQALASPNCILISEDTHRLVGSLFDCEAKGEHALKGFSHPVAVWYVLGESPNASRFKSVRGKHAGFFGRGAELELLHARWEEASAGNGYTAVILGEAGIGKSRLVAMLRERISGHRHNAIFWQCSPYHMNSALHPVIQYIEAAASIGPTDAKTVVDNSRYCRATEAAVSLALNIGRADPEP
jgi:class 3 adenylate cyclase